MSIKKIRWHDRSEWISIRNMYLGGSDAGAVIGMNPFKSSYSLWMEKTGRIPGFEGNLATEVGAFLEDFVAKKFEEQEGKRVKRQNATLVNDSYPFACANVDRVIVGENAILECKTTSSVPNMKKIRNGEFPDTWYCQCLHYLAVGKYDRAYLAVLVSNTDFRVFILDRDEDEIAALMVAECNFWDKVVHDEPPEVDGAQSTTDAIETFYHESNDDECSLTAYESDLRQYAELGGQIKAMKELQDGFANRIKSFMGECGSGVSDSFRVSWKTSQRNAFDHKRFAEDHPQMDISAYYTTTESRTFRITERKHIS